MKENEFTITSLFMPCVRVIAVSLLCFGLQKQTAGTRKESRLENIQDYHRCHCCANPSSGILFWD